MNRGIAAIAAMAAWMLFIPAASDAAVYKWKSIGSGDWNVPGNWERVSGEPCAAQFPNCVNDEAVFPSTLGFPTFVDIPADMMVTVGAITVYSDQGVTIREKLNNSGRLVFTTSTGGPALLRNFSSGGFVTLNVRMQLQSNLTIMAAVNTDVRLSGVTEVGARAITKSGAGMLMFREQVDHSGGTRIEDGVLELTGNPGSKSGALEIGDGTGDAESARVVAIGGNLLDASNVVVNRDGVLRVAESSKIGNLTVNDGFVAVEAQKQLYLSGELKMTGGLLFAYAGAQITFERDVTATASQIGPARFVVGDNTATFNLFAPGAMRMFTVNDGPGDVDLQIGANLLGPRSGLLKEGAGVLRFVGSGVNKYEGVTQVRGGRLELARLADAIAVPGRLDIGAAVVHVMAASGGQNIADTASVFVANGGLLTVSAEESIGNLTMDPGSRVVVDPHINDKASNLRTRTLSMSGGRITVNGGLHLREKLTATSSAAEAAVIDNGGTGSVILADDVDIEVADGPQAVDLRFDPKITSPAGKGFTKRGAGVAQFGGANTFRGATKVQDGAMLVTGQLSSSAITATGGTLGGNGRLGRVTATGGTIAPGLSTGRLTTEAITLGAGATLSMELNGTTPGTAYDQLDVTGAVDLGGAKLSIVARFTPAPRASFTLILNDAADAVVGTFAGLAEGAAVRVSGRDFNITYRGGDGNDVVLADTTSLLSYYLAEGATGEFFDDDVLIANPNGKEAPVTLTFLQEGGGTIVARRTIAANSRITVHVDEIAGLENSSASVQVTSDNNLPLVVERSMFWDASYYGGHTANAMAQPETRWIFAEGFQGFFDTYILIANTNAEETTATVTFLREGDTPVVATVPIGAFARKTIHAKDYPEVVGHAFGIIVEATRPVIAERSMYFASQPDRLWVGGHVNTGIVAPSTSWFHAEGATGQYFSTFILLSNPQDTEAKIELRFLLDTGEVVTRNKTLAAKQRLTVNPATEGDTRLEDAAVSTVVQSDVPIVSERSMYWSENGINFGEGHNSSGLASTGTRWGLAEGRLGGPHGFDTFILLANPSTTEAQVTITYLREGGTPLTRSYTVSPTSRFNVDVKESVPELRGSSFGARIEVANGVPIAVERSLYWNANGVLWAGGSNALATALP